MIKKSFRLMLLVAFALSSVMFVACNKYDDDIERIDSELAALNATVSSLKAAVDGGAVISSVSNTTDGVKFTLSNGQSYTVNHGTAGANGANGANGKDGSVVTIGENGNWFIDGVDTGKSAKGQDGKAPQINAAGNWEVWDAATQSWVDTKQSAVGAQTYVIEYTAYFELHVMQKDAAGNNMGYNVVLLPKTLPISDIKVVTLNDNVIVKDGAEIALNYGSALAKAKSFNGKDYVAGSYLTASNASLSAMINPTSVNASGLGFTLVDSKGNAPYVISNVTANMTEASLTRADETPNAGVWDMAVELHPDLTYQDLAGNTFAEARSKAYYALAVQTATGTIASAYDVKVTEQNVTNITVGTLKDLTGKVNEGLNLRKAFKETTGSTITLAGSSATSVADLNPYIIDCYFKVVDQTVASQNGIQLNGDILTTQKPVANVAVKAYYLLVDGTEMDAADYHDGADFTVTFNQVASSMSLGEVKWTIKAYTGSSSYQYVYLPINDELRSILTGTADGQIPTVAPVKEDGKVVWTWADGSELDSKAVAVNGVQYGYGTNAVKFADSNLDKWIAEIREGKLMWYDSYNGVYADAPSIQEAKYVRFKFNTENAFPGEYKVTLAFKKGTTDSDVIVQVPVKVVIAVPTSYRLVRNDAYFSGDDAVAYGDASGSNVEFNLFNLYKSLKNSYDDQAPYVSFTTSHDSHSGCATEWLKNYDADGRSTDGDISVAKFNSSYAATNWRNADRVYSTRQVQVRYKVFNNPHIPYVTDEFNLTIKSELYEGTFDATSAAITIANTQTHLISLKNVVAKDVYGNVYNLAPTYKYCEEHKAYDDLLVTPKDSRIDGDVQLILSDDNASQYLEVVSGVVNAQDGYSALQIKRKADSNGGYAALASDVTCVVKVRITDMWGRRIESPVTVTIKKN